MTATSHSAATQRLRCIAAATLLCLTAAAAAAAPAEPIIITSASKQFVVRGRPQTSMLSGTRSGVVYVDPALLAMVCERVREAVQHQLHWSQGWRDTIFIEVHPSSGRHQQTTFHAIWAGTRGWQYHVEMPDELTRRDFLEPLIEVLLLEYANRGAREESVELPPWLVEGLTEHLISGELTGLALQPNTFVVRDYRDQAGPAVRAKLQAHGALTLDQLNWPDFDDHDTAAAELYRDSSHLFVRELLRLRDGADCIAAMLAILPEHLNWQTAFLRAFEPHFQRMLDAEKWWSLVVVDTKLHEKNIAWAPKESQARLDEILYTPMQVRLTKSEMPHVNPVGLQTLMSDWAFEDQEPILRGKVRQLLLIRTHVPAEFSVLADQYRAAIEKYLAARSSKKLRDKDAAARPVKALLRSMADELGVLDDRRARLGNSARAETAASPGPEGAEVPPAEAGTKTVRPQRRKG